MKLSAVRPVARALLREAAVTGLLLLGVTLVVFGLLALAPGDPTRLLLEARGTEGAVAGAGGGAAPTAGGWAGRYLHWLSGIVRGDFGTSFRTGTAVLPELLRVGWNTLLLTLGAMVVTLAVAIPVAVLGAVRPDTRAALAPTLAAYLLSALPVFWLGYLVIYIAMRGFGVFPVLSGGGGAAASGWLGLLLPVAVLGVGNGTISEAIRHLREEMARVLGEDYIRTARAKGAPVWRHAFREGFLIPVTEIAASKIPYVLGGAVIVEQVFNWPGMGRLAWQAAQDRDYPVIMGIALAMAVFVRAGALLQRFVYIWVDPGASRS